MLIEEDLTHQILGAFFQVNRTLGHGFLEHVYSLALEYELRQRNLEVCREYGVPIYYAGFKLTEQRLDFVVEGRVVLELKATEHLPRDSARQLYNYLRATNLEVGLLLHFNRAGDFYRVVCRNAAKRRPLGPHRPEGP